MTERMSAPARQWQMVKGDHPGLWYLPSNDRRHLFRLRRWTEEGATIDPPEPDRDWWEVYVIPAAVVERCLNGPHPEDWEHLDEWQPVEHYKRTRRSAIDCAMQTEARGL